MTSHTSESRRTHAPGSMRGVVVVAVVAGATGAQCLAERTHLCLGIFASVTSLLTEGYAVDHHLHVTQTQADTPPKLFCNAHPLRHNPNTP